MKLVKNTEDNKQLKKVSDKEAEDAFRTILSWMGEDPSREGLLETPKRVVKAFKEYFTSLAAAEAAASKGSTKLLGAAEAAASHEGLV